MAGSIRPLGLAGSSSDPQGGNREVPAGTIFALSSGRPPAAIAVVRVSGPQAHRAAAALCGTLPEARHAAVRTLRHPQNGETLDEALVLRFDAPASATGEDLVEFHCHGGRAVVDAVLAALAGMAGVRAAEPGEFTRRAFLNGRIDLTEAEGLSDLLEAETEAQRKAALALAGGALRAQTERWRERVLALSAEAELAIDYVGEDEARGVTGVAVGCGELAAELEEWLARPRIEPLRDGVRVVIAGPPNSGKSSLLNAIVGYDRALVADQAGTTRDHVDVHLALGGVPFVLTDTAGLRDSADPIEAQGIDRAERLMAGADIVLWLGDPEAVLEHRRVIRVRPKADLGPAEGGDERLSVSARTGEGLGEVLNALKGSAHAILPGKDQVALNRRQAEEIASTAGALRRASTAIDEVLIAEELRQAREALSRLSGRSGIKDFLDTLFGRFCLGK